MSEGTKPTTMIVVAAGQEFSVPLGTPEQDIRSHLAATFPDVANATPQWSKRTVEGVEYKVLEFVKRAGTKGADLLELLADIPPLWDGVLAPAALELVRRFLSGNMKVGEALDLNLVTIIENVPESSYRTSGRTLCAQLDLLSPSPATNPAAFESGW